MALPNAPFGLRPAKHLTGGIIRYNRYPIASGYAQDLFVGDPVVLSSGTIQIATAGASNVILGAFMGCFFTDATIGPRFSPRWINAQTDSPQMNAQLTAYALVADDPDTLFEVMMDSSTAANATVIGKTTNLTSGTGSTTSNLSGWLASSTTGTANTGQLKIMDVIQTPNNMGNLGTPAGANAIALVRINQHFNNSATAGV